MLVMMSTMKSQHSQPFSEEEDFMPQNEPEFDDELVEFEESEYPFEEWTPPTALTPIYFSESDL